jgi:hypothetical protein
LITFGVAIIALSIVGGAIYLSLSYNEFQGRLHALGAGPNAPISLYEVAKWQVARVLGTAIIFGGWIFGSVLMGLGWVGKTLEEIRDVLAGEPTEASESLASKDSKGPV